MNYKVGDVVHVKDDLSVWKSYGYYTVLSAMEGYAGQECTVSDIRGYGKARHYILRGEDGVNLKDGYGYEFKWLDSMLTRAIRSSDKNIYRINKKEFLSVF